MANLNESLKEAVCIEEEIFFGPITDKERKIREQFQSTCENENKIPEPSNVNENDISKNDSLYKSFSVEESKYDSFDDSLNEEADKMPKETKHATLRKSLDKLKSKRYGFYDSLEDVCSLMSNLDKCSISCEVENDVNLNNLHVVEDSLKNPPVPMANKSLVLNEQIDDDSLAIVEYENTFDDSLEEVNVLENIEVEEIEELENLIAENHCVSIRVENNDPVCAPRNLFDTSVQVIYEKKKGSDTADHEELFDDKNLLYDSLSNSDLKDMLKDSLDESDKQSEYLDLLKKMSESDVNVVKPKIRVEKQNLFDSSVQVISDTKNNCDITDQEESSDEKNILYDSLSNSDFNDVLKDSLVESEKLIKYTDLLNQDSNLNVNTGGMKSESINANSSPFDTSVQIIYENFCNVGPNESTLEKTDSENNDISKDSLENSTKNNISKDSLENSKDISNELTQKSKMKITALQNLHTSDEKADYLSEVTDAIQKPAGGCLADTVDNKSALLVKPSAVEVNKTTQYNSAISEPVISISMSSKAVILNEVTDAVQKHPNNNSDIVKNESVLCLEAPIIEDDKVTKSNLAATEPVIPVSTSVALDVQKEAFSVDSCHLKILTDDTNSMNIDKDLKFQVHLELTIGDKKCQIATEDLTLAPPSSLTSKESVSVITVKSPLASPAQDSAKCVSGETEIDILDTSSSDLNNQGKLSMSTETIQYMNSYEKARRKTETSDVSNITQRGKSSSSKMFSSPSNLNDTSLLQALDLHDISLFLNDSLVQSENSLMPLNLSSRDDDVQNIHTPILSDNGKENVPEEFHVPKKKSSASSCKKISPNKVQSSKTPRDLQKCSSFKETTKKTPGTKIPVRKIENFAVPTATPIKFAKQAPSVLSSEKVKKCTHSPHSIDGDKKTPGSTPNKGHHYCKVRNTIFSKVPQMVPSKKYMNIQSPVAQYINSNGGVKTPCFDQVLRDCMNRPVESPYCSHQTPKSGSLKSVKKKV